MQAHNGNNAAHVVLIHGLWFNKHVMSYIGHGLKRKGYTVSGFTYHSVRRTPAQNALQLHTFVQHISAPTIHFVCHSLGGIVIRHYYHQFNDHKPGRVVTLGTPHQGSIAATSLARWAGPLLGKSMLQGLAGEAPRWDGSHELGVIAGNTAMGLGRFIASIPTPSDGTVALKETHIKGERDHIVLPVSHFSILFSRPVVEQVHTFLSTGHFEH